MKKIDTISEVYQYLKYVKELTENGYVIINKIESRNKRGLNAKTLISNGILSSYDKSVTRRTSLIHCSWGGKPCNYALAYDYYHMVRSSPERYENVLKILSNPTTTEINDYMDAMKIKARHDIEMNVSVTQPNVVSEPLMTKLKKNSLHEKIIINGDGDLMKKNEAQLQNEGDKKRFYALMENIETQFNKNMIDNLKIIELFTEISNLTLDTNSRVNNLQNSFSGIFSITRVNQENLFIQSAVLMNLVKALMSLLNENKIFEDDKKLEEIKMILGEAMKHLRSQVNSNNTLAARYGTYSNKV